MSKESNNKILKSALMQLQKKHGADVFVDTENPIFHPAISTGSMMIDKDSGIGGIPEGKITEIYGDFSSGKTSTTSSIIAQAQLKYPDKKVLFVDTEQAYDLLYAQQLGVNTDPDSFVFVQPDTIEVALDIMETMMATGLFSLAVLDSVGGSLTADQLAKGMDENTMGSLAKRMSVGCNKIKNVANKTNTAVIMINQIYSKMSLYASNATETKGGRALKFSASMRIELKKRDLLASEGNKEDIIGQAISYNFRKNKLGRPFISGETILYFGKGFDKTTEIINVAISVGLIERGGAWYNFVDHLGGAQKFQGKDRVIEYLAASPKDLIMFEEKVLKSLQSKQDTLYSKMEEEGLLEDDDSE